MKNLLQKQFITASCLPVLSFIIVFFCFAQDSFAQFCTGSVSYLIRDESGAKMSPLQLEKITIKKINGTEATVEKDSQGQIYYKIDTGIGATKIQFANPLRVIDICGGINDLTLQYGKKTMKLIFENRDSWTRFVIDSLPFQAGDFQLEKKFDGNKKVIQCEKADSTNESKVRFCNVSAQNWVRLNKQQ